MSIRNPSITYLITTVGEETLQQTLRSLYGQFGFGLDKVLLVFDGKMINHFTKFDDEVKMYGDSIEVAILDKNLGFWGHGIRNKYQHTCDTDYIHHMDSDDVYSPDVIKKVRQDLRENYGKLVIYKFRSDNNRVVWETPKLAFAQVGTPSGLIPNRKEIFGNWGYFYGGDFQFYQQVAENIGNENIVFKPDIIVKTKPHIYGY